MKGIGLFRFVFISVVMSTIITSCCSTKIVSCSDGNPVIVQRCPQKQFEQYVKSTNTNIKAGIDLLSKVKVEGLDIGLVTQITKLRADLDNFSSRFQDILKASFSAFSTAPCDKDIRLAHTRLLENMSKENAALEELKSRLANTKPNNISFVPYPVEIQAIISNYLNSSKTDSIK